MTGATNDVIYEIDSSSFVFLIQHRCHSTGFANPHTICFS